MNNDNHTTNNEELSAVSRRRFIQQGALKFGVGIGALTLTTKHAHADYPPSCTPVVQGMKACGTATQTVSGDDSSWICETGTGTHAATHDGVEGCGAATVTSGQTPFPRIQPITATCYPPSGMCFYAVV